MDCYVAHPTHVYRPRIYLTAVMAAAIAGSIGWRRLRGRAVIRRVVVEGTSMSPTLQPGDRLLIVASRQPVKGQIVALPDPREPRRMLVKRVTALTPQGVEVSGDNRASSTGSDTFGAVPLDSLRGRAVYRYAPAERAGRLE